MDQLVNIIALFALIAPAGVAIGHAVVISTLAGCFLAGIADGPKGGRLSGSAKH